MTVKAEEAKTYISVKFECGNVHHFGPGDVTKNRNNGFLYITEHSDGEWTETIINERFIKSLVTNAPLVKPDK